MRRLIFPCLLLVLAVFTVFAYIVQWGPFERHVVACPADAIAYQVAVDITRSNSDRDNWPQQMEKFVLLLKPCDSIRFRVIDDQTDTNGLFGDEISLPIEDPDAGYDGGAAVAGRDAAIKSVRESLNKLFTQQSPAKKTDILNIFNRLDHVALPPKKNKLIIFSDGLESAAKGVDLEHTCINDSHLETLLAAAQLRIGKSTDLGRFSEVVWVLTSRSGTPGCNALQELRRFWAAVMREESGGTMPSLQFETNPF